MDSDSIFKLSKSNLPIFVKYQIEIGSIL